MKKYLFLILLVGVCSACNRTYERRETTTVIPESAPTSQPSFPTTLPSDTQPASRPETLPH